MGTVPSEAMNTGCRHVTQCRICGGTDLAPVLDLGAMPPANAFLTEANLSAREERFPLALSFCNQCALLQLRDVVSPDTLFRQYDYLTSASAPLAEHFVREADHLAERFAVAKDDLVVELGGNDGVLLERIKERCRVLNVDPALNIVAFSRKRGIPTVGEFFSEELAQRILREHGTARLVIANNVVAHIDDLRGTCRGIRSLLTPKGAFVFEVHWVGNLIGDGGFDQIYHEHLSYFSLSSLMRLAERVGMTVFDVELVPIHGESMRVYMGRDIAPSAAVAEFLAMEERRGLTRRETFLAFAERVRLNRDALRSVLHRVKREGKKIVGYGAPAKGNTLLNYCGISRDVVDFLVDTTPLKQGRYAPGSRIPVHPPQRLDEAKPDYVLLLAWNYAGAIMKKEKGYAARGGKFIVPVPEPRIL